ncbi:hypothetical protein BTO06_01760 [Tenacibaculum sp. SZ-18]|uniref:hypothetical protein n=1 Tax=Tenacibaculum sp. SZ-18 TaxID=754423 RepID=UPI000C2CF516|nr:hypothetical protein [Tenacibaculum sp. SZ-18]AUC13955.1 hypothetical protein BTO06_01760 [Tenacibaculum sp. SZ-18]
MKLKYLLLIGLVTTLFNCKTDKLEQFIPENHLASFQTEKPQFFDLDTLEYKTIIGKHGTKIMYYRELFDTIYKDPIQLELTELYDFKEILYRNIPTITTKDELLETSGVLKIKFTSNGKELEIREGEKLIVYPPGNKLKNNNIFLSEKDSITNIKWNLTDQNYVYISILLGGGISKRIYIPFDALSENEKSRIKSKQIINADELIHLELKNEINSFILESIKEKWINIDKFIQPEKKISFNIEENIDFSGYNTYVQYEDLNSFLSYTVTEDMLTLKNIPIKGRVNLIVVGRNLEGIFFDKINLNTISDNSEIKLDMKKTSKHDLKKLFE